MFDATKNNESFLIGKGNFFHATKLWQTTSNNTSNN